MFLIDQIILLAGAMLLLGIASSKASARYGVPVLVLFLALGMLAGSEGIGGIDFENYTLAHAVGTLALAVILFDGGLSTPRASVRAAWRPAAALANAGVLLTALVTGVAAAWILGVSLLEGLLLGSIVGSTDAAAVFAVLRSGGVRLPRRLAATLEIESGANDPMAIFLTVGCIEVLAGQMDFGWGMATLFLKQMGLGAAAGLAIGYAAVAVINRINLEAAGLYPILASAFGLLAFGMAAATGGSGFLAVYLAGILIGNKRLVFQRGIFLFHDAAAWLAQIVMFVVLGLLSFPSRLLDVAGLGLAVAAVLMLVARPLAVVLTLLPFRYPPRELAFLSWGGLKGAVPITLATFPLLRGLPGTEVLFDVVFFVVLVSASIQGWTLPLAARRLGVETPAEPEPPVTLEISSLRHVDGDIVDYAIDARTHAAGRVVSELALPEGAVIALIARQRQLIPPQGNTRIEVGDHVILVLRPEARPLVNQVFARDRGQASDLPAAVEFPLRPATKVRELEEFYGIAIDLPPDLSLDQALRRRLGPQGLKRGSAVRCGQIELRVRELTERGTITAIGMVILPVVDAELPETAKPADAAGVESHGETDAVAQQLPARPPDAG